MLATAFLIIIAANSCSKRYHPAISDPEPAATNANKDVSKPKAAVKIKTAIPKVIVVNDKAAKKSIDGRYYYDLEGHRYWRNNRDGKYYLFHRSMFDNADFKSSGN